MKFSIHCVCLYDYAYPYVHVHLGPRYIELFLHSTEDTGGPQAGAGAVGGIKYGQPPQAQQGWGDSRAQVGDKGVRVRVRVKDREGEREREKEPCALFV